MNYGTKLFVEKKTNLTSNISEQIIVQMKISSLSRLISV